MIGELGGLVVKASWVADPAETVVLAVAGVSDPDEAVSVLVPAFV
jgi:hypothetical protein